MNKKTLKALKGSIKKWEKIVDGTGRDNGGDNCPLCLLFIMNMDNDKDCPDCPIGIKTGENFCEKTPYLAWLNHTRGKHDQSSSIEVKCPTCKKLAIKELDFLKSLLPKENETN